MEEAFHKVYKKARFIAKETVDPTQENNNDEKLARASFILFFPFLISSLPITMTLVPRENL